MKRRLLLFKSQRDARAVFSVRARGGTAYWGQLKHSQADGTEVVYGFGTDPREVWAKYGAGQLWDEISWRWDAPEELRTRMLAQIRQTEAA